MQAKKQIKNYLIHPNSGFENATMLCVLPFENKVDEISCTNYYLHIIELKNYKLFINKEKIFLTNLKIGAYEKTMAVTRIFRKNTRKN